MLSGQFLNNNNPTVINPSLNYNSLLLSGSVSPPSSPYLKLLTLCHTMALTEQNNIVDEDLFLENGLSYENPNYHMDPSRLDDALNSNMDDGRTYEDIYSELDAVCKFKNKTMTTGNCRYIVDNMDVTEKNTSLISNLEETFDMKNKLNQVNDNISLINDNDNIANTLPHIAGDINNDLYAVPVKRQQHPMPQKNVSPSKIIPVKLSPDEYYNLDAEDDNTIKDNEENLKNNEKSANDIGLSKDKTLPFGWEKHEDNDGPYYWHIKSGTIQREMPEILANCEQLKNNQSEKEIATPKQENIMQTSVTRSNTSSNLDLDLEERKRKDENVLKRRSYPARLELGDSKERPVRFAVRSLGWVEISEDDLTPERSSKAVNKCIVDLSLGRNDLLDVVGRWGDGKDLFMDLDEGALKLIDPENLTVLNTQPIHTIRVWGVGRDNGRDFAYVARDRSTRKHMCHVFRCDMPARTIANTLRDICKRIMIERSIQQNLTKPGIEQQITRPTNLPTEQRRSHRNSHFLVTQSFPTPMEEPKKVLRAQYLGNIQVNQATGMEVLNNAIDLLSNEKPETWINVNVAVAPSMITIHSSTDENSIIAECRVRYLSFLGIGRNVKQCAFIMHTAQDIFIAHVFHCEPSSGALCKTIEAACKLRYQKCLDAHPQSQTSQRTQNGAQTPGRSLGATLKSLVGTITGRRSSLNSTKTES